MEPGSTENIPLQIPKLIFFSNMDGLYQNNIDCWLDSFNHSQKSGDSEDLDFFFPSIGREQWLGQGIEIFKEVQERIRENGFSFECMRCVTLKESSFPRDIPSRLLPTDLFEVMTPPTLYLQRSPRRWLGEEIPLPFSYGTPFNASFFQYNEGGCYERWIIFYASR